MSDYGFDRDRLLQVISGARFSLLRHKRLKNRGLGNFTSALLGRFTSAMNNCNTTN